MPEIDAFSNATQATQATEGCGHDKRHIKKRQHKRKRDDTYTDGLIEHGTPADNKKPTKEKYQKMKKDDDSYKGSDGHSHKGNKLIEQEIQFEEVDPGNEKIEKGYHKRKKDGSCKENESFPQKMQYKDVSTEKKKDTNITHQKRKRNDLHKENEPTKQDIQLRAADVDKKTHKRKGSDKRKKNYSHMENKLLDHESPSKEVMVHKKSRLKMQNSISNDVNESALSENSNCDGSMVAGGSNAKLVNERPSTSVKSPISKGKKTVSFSSDIEVLSASKNRKRNSNSSDDGLVRGKRFTPEEDQIIKDACLQYVEDHALDGVTMILNSKKHPKARGCWKEIGASIPWRPVTSVYIRAAYIFRERTEPRKWTPEDIKLIQSYVAKHGRQFKELAQIFNVHRHQVKDAWRRNRLPNARKGSWSIDEYNQFFELVNEDLILKAFEEGGNKSAMIRENISWWAISDKLETRYDPDICYKWYNQLTSPMVSQGLWSSCDDYHLLYSLSELDACCFEDVDWDNILKNRDGVVCRKRWLEMTRHIGGNVERTFTEQVELLSNRYHIDMLPYRKKSLSIPDSESEGSESD